MGQKRVFDLLRLCTKPLYSNRSGAFGSFSFISVSYTEHIWQTCSHAIWVTDSSKSSLDCFVPTPATWETAVLFQSAPGFPNAVSFPTGHRRVALQNEFRLGTALPCTSRAPDQGQIVLTRRRRFTLRMFPGSAYPQSPRRKAPEPRKLWQTYFQHWQFSLVVLCLRFLHWENRSASSAETLLLATKFQKSTTKHGSELTWARWHCRTTRFSNI